MIHHYKLKDIISICQYSNTPLLKDTKAYFTIITPYNKLIEKEGKVEEHFVSCPLLIDYFGEYKVSIVIDCPRCVYRISENFRIEEPLEILQ